MTTEGTESTETDEPNKGKRNWPVILLCCGFVILVLAAAVGYLVMASSLSRATKQLDRRSITVGYLGDDNEWDNCNDDKNREFFSAIADVAAAPRGSDQAKKAAKRLADIKIELDNIDEVEVCGPPPPPPADPDDKEGN